MDGQLVGVRVVQRLELTSPQGSPQSEISSQPTSSAERFLASPQRNKFTAGTAEFIAVRKNHVIVGRGALPKKPQQTVRVNAPSRNTKSMRNAMTELLALSVSVAVLGGIWAFIALSPLGGFALVWVGFIAAGCFFAAGGDTKALSKTIVGMIYGAIVAWIALLIIAKVPVPALGTVWPAIVVGVTVFFLVIVASIDLLSCVPANVYGYAALVGYTLSAGKLDALTAADNSNPLFLIVVSAILGALLGYLMGQLAGVLRSAARTSA
jgi:Protein of unknown function (DUF1097)